ncbi:OLC1v1017109C1 [Oldenlandia corymbosa var. corymbosa]|uniref:OLC1v1017109C1 n=1 Tax=Oldenlandia corymbosa var. corymbosa TaxID=529605 RepID=A0AAV1E8P4_OLDCO|nr:OLC1v1017109C1 [Oldenlandia corymbosa var. corymbosa]
MLCPQDLDALKKFSGYVSTTESRRIKLQTTRSPNFLGLNQNIGLWPLSGYGHDSIIGIVDSGIWPEKPSFSDRGMSEIPSRWKGECENATDFNSTMCNRKLIGARHFSKGIFAEDPDAEIPINSPRDTIGHGTHCASISSGGYVESAAYGGYGLGVARGAAPNSRIAVYKAYFSDGKGSEIGTSADILAAINQAIVDGVDVLSLSIGEEGTFYEKLLAAGTFSAMRKGIFVSMAAGNDGDFPNDFPWVLNVGAGTIDREFGGTVLLSNGGTIQGQSMYTGEALLSEIPLIDLKTCQDAHEVHKYRSKIVVCQPQGNLSIDELRDLVFMVKGVRGAVFIANFIDYDDVIKTRYPALFVTPRDGKTILEYTRTSPNPTARMVFGETRIDTKPSPEVAGFSSKGPSLNCPLVLKPDILAPGENILVSWSPYYWAGDVESMETYGWFRFSSGTSMAAPHAAGIGAMLRVAHPDWSPAAIRSAMLTTADVVDNIGEPIKDVESGGRNANPFEMGCGHLNPNRAVDPGLIYNASAQDYINLLCAMNDIREQIFAVVGSFGFDCGNSSSDLNYPSFMVLYEPDDGVDSLIWEFKRRVTNVVDGGSRYKAFVTAPKDSNVTVSPNFLEFNSKNEEQTYTLILRYAGAKNGTVTFGHLKWAQENGNHTVSSLIAISQKNYRSG